MLNSLKVSRYGDFAPLAIKLFSLLKQLDTKTIEVIYIKYAQEGHSKFQINPQAACLTGAFSHSSPHQSLRINCTNTPHTAALSEKHSKNVGALNSRAQQRYINVWFVHTHIESHQTARDIENSCGGEWDHFQKWVCRGPKIKYPAAAVEK
jgi:hypothetical protein